VLFDVGDCLIGASDTLPWVGCLMGKSVFSIENVDFPA
jgi:hypothetical protein